MAKIQMNVTHLILPLRDFIQWEAVSGAFEEQLRVAVFTNSACSDSRRQCAMYDVRCTMYLELMTPTPETEFLMWEKQQILTLSHLSPCKRAGFR